MSPLPLTVQQEKLWRFIKSCARSPSYDEMAVAMGKLHRGAAVDRAIQSLEAKGYIRRTRYRARSIIALDPSADLAGFKTSELLAELTNRGVMLGVLA